MLELQRFYRLIVHGEQSFPVADEHATLKGLFIVALYGWLEFGMTKYTTNAIEYLNSMCVMQSHLQSSMFALVCADQFKSAASLKGERKWYKQLEIITSHEANQHCSANEAALSDVVQNSGPSTFELIFKLFDLRGVPVVDGRTAGLLNEIRERRNAVAHGRETASAVGGRFSEKALGERLHVAESQMTHLALSFDEWVADKLFLGPSFRSIYMQV